MVHLLQGGGVVSVSLGFFFVLSRNASVEAHHIVEDGRTKCLKLSSNWVHAHHGLVFFYSASEKGSRVFGGGIIRISLYPL